MSAPPSPDPHQDADPRPASRRRWTVWRIGTPLAVLASGLLFVVSGSNSEGTDLRPGRYVDLATLVQDESDSYDELQATERRLRSQVDDLTDSVADKTVRRKRREADRLRAAAGLEPVSGPGVTVVLSDAPDDKIQTAYNDPEKDLFEYVVHQQDIQAVVNAFWAAGAEAVTVQGQRIVSTTGIKCHGSVVQLQGALYPQPYVISAVGDPDRLVTSVDTDPDVGAFRAAAANEEIQLGYEIDLEDQVEAPAYDGLLDISSAEPAR